MRGRSIGIAAVSSVVLSCALISGAGDLTIGPVLEREAGPAPAKASTPADATPGEASAEAAFDDAGASPACDEPGLEARWTFDEGVGLVVGDCTTHHHDGQVLGGRWVDGERDGGMDFDGGWVGFGNPPGLQLSGPLTACAWIRVASPPPLAGGGRAYVVDKLFMPSNGGWRLAIGRAGPGGALGATVEISDPDGGFHETIGGSIALATWTHICAVFRGTSQSVYVSGLEAATGATPAGVITLTSDEVRIGIRGDGMQPYIGAVDDVRIYSRALDAGEIAALAQP